MPRIRAVAISRARIMVLSFWMKSARCRWFYRPIYCGFSKHYAFIALGVRKSNALSYRSFRLTMWLARRKELVDVGRIAESSAVQRLAGVQEQVHLSPDGFDLGELLGDIERNLVGEALARCYGKQVQAAALLRICRDELCCRFAYSGKMLG